MTRMGMLLWMGVVSAFAAVPLPAQQSSGQVSTEPALSAVASAGTVVPRLVRFAGNVTDGTGKPATGAVAVTFSLYELQEGGSPLWSETQTLTVGESGRYTVLLGAASSEGLPLDLFISGAARWLGVAPALPGVGERPRVLLVGVPYALKAADADTLGGKPASAFVTTESAAPSTPGSAQGFGLAQGNAGRNTSATGAAASAKAQTRTPASTITGSGTANYVPLWTSSTTLGNSAAFQAGTGGSAKIGIGTTSPTTLLQVNGASEILSTGSGAGLEFQDRAGGTSAYGAWYSTGNVDRFWRSDLNGKGGDVIGITNAGNVGIGTDSPAFNLQVAGPSTPQVRVSSLSTSGSSVSYLSADANAAKTVAIFAADGLGTGPLKTPSAFFGAFTNQPVGIVTNDAERLRVTATGQVGIATTTPAATLEVNGTAKFDQAVTFAGGQTFPGAATLGANAFTGNQTITGNVSATQSGSGPAIDASNTAGTGQTVGAEGVVSATTGSGVLGVNVKSSNTGLANAGYVGVWGDTGQATNEGVLGTADDGFGVAAINDSANDAALFAENLGTGAMFKAVSSTDSCYIDTGGNLFCTGSKSAVVPVQDGRHVALYAVEAPENWFEDFGFATLENGEAAVKLEPTFVQTVNTAIEYHVFLTPKGDCEGLYVTNETPSGFEVHELRQGHSNVAFDYRIVARRKGYENIRLADKTKEMDAPRPDSLRERRSEHE